MLHQLGKRISIEMPTRSSIIKEYFGGKEQIYKKFTNTIRIIREYRNKIIHNILIGKLISLDEKVFVPKPENILSYITWDRIGEVANNKAIIEKDFAGIWEVTNSQITALETMLNLVWDIVINEFVAEFYTDQRSVLRDFYGITLSERASETIFVIDNHIRGSTYIGSVSSTANVATTAGTAILSSGVLTSGSSVIPRIEDK